MIFPVAHDLTKSDFDALDWHKVVDDAESADCFEYRRLFFERALVAQKQEDIPSLAVYALLVQVTSLILDPQNPHKPFQSAIENIKKEHLDLLREISPEIRDPELLSRVGDLLWITSQDYQAARKAVGGYIRAAKTLDTSEKHLRIKRAFQLATQLGKKNQPFKDTVSYIEELLRDTNRDYYFESNLIEMLISVRHDGVSKYIPLLETLATEAENQHKGHVASRLWKLKADIHRLDGDDVATKKAIMQSAEAFVTFAEYRSTNSNYIAATLDIQEAIKIYRKLGGNEAQERIQELHLRLLEYENLSVAGMKRIKITADDTTNQRINQAREYARSQVSGKSLIDAIFTLSAITAPASTDSLHEEIRNLSKANPYSFVINKRRVDDEGKVKGHQEGLNLFGDGADALAIKSHALSQAISHRDTSVLTAIYPALRQIRIEHPVIRVQDFRDLVQNNPFIPFDRQEIFSHGLWAGLTGDFFLATHLLLPQFENSIRHIMQLFGVITSGLNDDMIQQDYTLGRLLRTPELNDMLGANTIFDLQGLLIESLGSNIRNRVAHGLVETDEFDDYQFVYLWWLVLRLCCAFIAEANQENSAKVGSSEGDTINHES